MYILNYLYYIYMIYIYIYIDISICAITYLYRYIYHIIRQELAGPGQKELSCQVEEEPIKKTNHK